MPTKVVPMWPFLLAAGLMALTITLPLVYVEERTEWVLGAATWPIGVAAALASVTCGVLAVRARMRRAALGRRAVPSRLLRWTGLSGFSFLCS